MNIRSAGREMEFPRTYWNIRRAMAASWMREHVAESDKAQYLAVIK
jgi:hypothetical protein